MNPSTIFIESADEKVVVRERLALAAFSPGHLLEIDGGTHAKHSTAAGASQKLFGLENLADAGDIDRLYAAGESSRAGYAKQGDLVYAFIAVVPAIAIGDALESAGDGTLRAATGEQIVGFAAEAVDNSGGAGEVRLQVEVA